MGKIIAVVNQKGGVGKTTTAVNLSACLGKLGQKVLLIDLDPQSNATSGVGIDKSQISEGIYKAIIGHRPLIGVIMHTEFGNLDVIPSTPDLAGAEVELLELENRHYQLKDELVPLKHNYNYIIIDCPPSLGQLTMNALCAADSVLIPIQCDYYALEGLIQLMKTVELVQKQMNTNLKVEGLVMTMGDLRTNLAKQVVDEVKNHFGDKVFKTIIFRNIRLSEAPGFGKPIVYYDINSAGAENYLSLAQEIVTQNKEVELDQESVG
ncbi:MAG: AAA family ATPase [bacterium]|nr:AAA family ATPase [bacterium]